MIGEKENNRVWIDYNRVHQDSTVLAEKIIERTPTGIITIAVARGGWIPARIVASVLDESGVENRCYSVTASYNNAGQRDEYTSISQGMDDKSLETMYELGTERGFNLWVIEAICHTGRAAKSVHDYLSEQMTMVALRRGMPETELPIYFGTMHLTAFEQSPEAPWRMEKAYIPDCYGDIIQSVTKPHVEYPWEYGSLGTYQAAIQSSGGKLL